MWNDIQVIDSAESSVKKLVFKNDKAVAEAVLYKYPTYADRTVICCSTMAGCPVGCRFCGAGDYFVKALTSQEIVSQVDKCIDLTEISHIDMNRLQIMFMSMGEPLLNRMHMIDSLIALNEKYPNAKLLISTIGPRIDYDWVNGISATIENIGLQFSIHESTDDARDKLIPYRRKLSLAEIASTGERWARATGRKPFFNYCVHDNNNSDDDVNRLSALFDPTIWQATISVICERNEGLPARNDHQKQLALDFSEKLLIKGYNVRVFDPAGQDDIGGGCGQLWFVQEWMKEHPELAKPSVGNGLPEVHTPIAA